MKTSNWSPEQLERRTDQLLGSFRGLSDLHKGAETLCADNARSLPVDFMEEVHTFRQRIDALLTNLTTFKRSLVFAKQTDSVLTASLPALNERLDKFSDECATILFAWDSIVTHQKQLMLVNRFASHFE